MIVPVILQQNLWGYATGSGSYEQELTHISNVICEVPRASITSFIGPERIEPVFMTSHNSS